MILVPNSLRGFSAAYPSIGVGSLQVWIITDHGQKRVAVTTNEGVAVVGDIISPDGQNLSPAILALRDLVTPGLLTNPSKEQPGSGPRVSELEMAASAPLAEGPASTAPAPLRRDDHQALAADPTSSGPIEHLPPQSEDANRPSGAGSAPLTIAKAQTLDELFQQATDVAAWFSAGKPKPNAPAIYLFADPTCPHCAAAIDRVAQKVEAGDIDLRVILAPFRSQQAVYEAASILQSNDVAGDFMSHELAKTRSVIDRLKVLPPESLDADIVRALQRNVEWGRESGFAGAPLWIFRTADGAKVQFGDVKDSMLDTALPAPRSTAALTKDATP